MNVLVSASARFVVTGDGHLWTANSSLEYRFWTRYLDVFDEVQLMARAVGCTTPPDGWNRVTGPGVRGVPVPDFRSVTQLVRVYPRLRRTIRSLLSEEIAVNLRLPCPLGEMVWRSLEARRPHAVEVVGDPYGIFSAGAVRHPMRTVFRWWFPRQLRRQVATACASAYVTERVLQSAYPAAPGAFSTHYSSIELPNSALASTPRAGVTTKRRLRLITVGSLAQMYKAPDVLIDAVGVCAREGWDLELTLVGDGKHAPELRSRAAAARVDSRVFFRGQLPDREAVRHELDRADLFVLPSRHDGLPKAMIEAMARALPCIGSSAGGISELLPPEDTVHPNDVEGLARKIREVVADPDRMARMSARNLATAKAYRADVLRARRIGFYEYLRAKTEESLSHPRAISAQQPVGASSQARPRIVYVITHPSSARVLLRGQLGFLRERGFDVVVISSGGKELDIVREREGVTTIAIPMHRAIRPAHDLVALVRLYHALRKLRPQIVNASTPKAGLLGMMAAWAARVPVRIYTLRGLRLETAKGPKRFLLGVGERMASACASRVICVGESLSRLYLRSGLAPARKVFVPGAGSSNGIDLNRFRAREETEGKGLLEKLAIPSGAPVIGFVGRLTRDKGIVGLLNGFEKLAGDFPDARLLLVGDFEEDDPVPSRVRGRLREHPRVTITGFVTDAAPYYYVMDVLAFPSHREGFPNVPLEAAAAEVPVVGFQATGTVDAIQDGITGTLVPKGDLAALAEALARYLHHAELRQEHGRAGRVRVSRDFRSEHIWSALEKELVRCLSTVREAPDGRVTLPEFRGTTE